MVVDALVTMNENQINHNKAFENLRQEAQTELNKYFAKFLTNMGQSKKAHAAFKIELLIQTWSQ